MTSVLSRNLPPPRNWQDFERLAFDVYSRLWQTNGAELHGRTGQPQSGVDVYGTDRVEKVVTGVQCKGKDASYGGAVTEKELRDEVAKALTFQPPLDVFVLATTGPNDVAIQAVARKITAEHKRTGLFEVRVTAWDTFRQHVTSYPDVLAKHFRDLAPIDPAGVFGTAQEDVQARLQRIEALTLRQTRLITGQADKAGGDPLSARITAVAELTSAGSPRAALKGLRKLLSEEGKEASPLARFRILANMAHAELALGRDEEATALFRQAHDAHPTHPEARGTLAFVELAAGDREGAFERATAALRDDPTSVSSAGVVVEATPDDVSTADLAAGLPEQLADEVAVKLHLAVRAQRLGDDRAALRFAEDAHRLAPDDWRTQATLSEALMRPLVDVDGLLVTHRLTGEQRGRVDQAIGLMRSAWSTLAAADSSHLGRHVAANLIGLLEIVGDDDGARTLLTEAAAQNPSYGPLLQRSAQRAASADRWREAVELVDRISPEEVYFEDSLLKVQALIRLKQVGEARAAADAMLANARAQDEREVAETLVGEADALAGPDPAEARRALLERHPTSILVRSLTFDFLRMDDPLRDAIADEVEQLAAGDLHMRSRIHAAEVLFCAGRHSKAADLLEPLQGTDDSYPLRRRLEALHLAGRRKEARKLFEALPPELRRKGRYLALGVEIYERAGLLKPALKLVEDVLEHHDELGNRLGWMQLLVRLGRSAELADWLRAVPEDVVGTPHQLMALAQVLDRQLPGDLKALAIGYRALRAGYGDPRVHLSFSIGLFINGNVERAGLRSPAKVEPGAGVVLRNEASGEHLFVLVETAADPVVERGERATDDDLVQQLLGLEAGAAIEIHKLGVGPQKLRVQEVQNGFVFAFQRTLREFPRLFPGHPAFASIDIDDSKGDERFEPMFAMARSAADRGRELEDTYRNGVVPLLMLARFSGSNVFDLWDGFRAGPVGGLKVAQGWEQEFVVGQIAAGAGLVVVDPLTIYGWVRMGIVDVMGGRRDRLGVVQSSIDMLRQLLEEREGQRGRKMGTFGWDGERYRMVELTEEALAGQIADAKAAVEFAEGLRLVPAERDQPLRTDVRDLIEDAHPAFHDTLVAGAQEGRAVLTDDLGFRVIAQEVGASATWTQAYLQSASATGGISRADYRAALDALLGSNYDLTQFGHIEILEELREAGWQLNARLSRFAALLTKPSLNPDSVVAVLSRLLLASDREAPSPQAFAIFPGAVAAALRDAPEPGNVVELFRKVEVATGIFVLAYLNARTLPARLLTSSSLTLPHHLTTDNRQQAARKARNLRSRLLDGGFDPG